MSLNKQPLMDIAPKFFWDVLRSVATVSATKNKSNCFWSLGDQSNPTASGFFIQWAPQTLLVDQKSFQAAEVSFTLISTNSAHQLFGERCCMKLDLQLRIYHIFFTKSSTQLCCESLSVHSRSCDTWLLYCIAENSPQEWHRFIRQDLV